jgi:hypothetical protein
MNDMQTQSASGQDGLVSMMVAFAVLALVGAVWEFGTFAFTGALLACIGALMMVTSLVQMTLVQFCRYLWVWTLTIVFPYLMLSGVWKGRNEFLTQVMVIGVGWFYCLLLFGKVKEMRSEWK